MSLYTSFGRSLYDVEAAALLGGRSYYNMAGAPSSREAITRYRLRLLVANSATFQTWVGVSTSTDALAYVHMEERENPTLPCALVSFPEYTVEHNATGVAYAGDREFVITFFGEIAEEDRDDNNNAINSMVNVAGEIIDEMMIASAASDPIGPFDFQFGRVSREGEDSEEVQGYVMRAELTLIAQVSFNG